MAAGGLGDSALEKGCGKNIHPSIVKPKSILWMFAINKL